VRERRAVCAYHASRGSVRVMVTVPCVLKLQSRCRRVVGSRVTLMVVPTAIVVPWYEEGPGVGVATATAPAWA
jgi:hypothetical protein